MGLRLLALGSHYYIVEAFCVHREIRNNGVYFKYELIYKFNKLYEKELFKFFYTSLNIIFTGEVPFKLKIVWIGWAVARNLLAILPYINLSRFS